MVFSVFGTNGDSRIPGNSDDELRKIEEGIKDREHQIQANLQRMEAKSREWEAENTRLSRRVTLIVLGLVAAAMLAYWSWA